MDSLEEFHALIGLCSKIFERPALAPVYQFATGGSSATSFMRPNQIIPHDRHQRCVAIRSGGAAAIGSVRKEFADEAGHYTARQYVQYLQDGSNNTHLLISVKGTHYPLNADVLPQEAKGASLIKIIRLYTETLQGGSNSTGRRTTRRGMKPSSAIVLGTP